LGPLRLAIFYFIVVIGSNIFGAVCSSEYAVGPDPIVFALIGCLFSMVALYWPKMGADWKPKVCTIVSLVMLLIIAIMMMASQATLYSKYTKTVNLAYPDIFGSIGGFIFGVSTAFILLPTAAN